MNLFSLNRLFHQQHCIALVRLEWFWFSDVIHFFASEIKPVYIFLQGFSNYQSAIESQVSRLAQLMRQYCEPLLSSDLSLQSGIREIERERVARMLEHFNELSENYRNDRAK